MKRISVSDVIAAYRATGLTPVRGTALSDDGTCGCAIGALAIASGAARRRIECVRWSLDALGAGYRLGFIAGFDRSEIFAGAGFDEQQGFTDGQAAAAAVFATGGDK